MRQEYLKQKKILLADDEEALLGMVETIFREGGFTEIVTAATVAEALEKAETQKLTDSAALDVMFPDGERSLSAQPDPAAKRYARLLSVRRGARMRTG